MLHAMKWLHQRVALLLLTLWLPATHCCALEWAGVVSLAACCDADGTGDAAQKPCNEKACCQLEAGSYKAEDLVSPILKPLHFVAVACPTLTTVAHFPHEPKANHCSSSCVSVPWHFSLRAALPPRAPSRAS